MIPVIPYEVIYFINPNTGFAAGGLYGLATNYLLTTTNTADNSWYAHPPGNGYLDISGI